VVLAGKCLTDAGFCMSVSNIGDKLSKCERKIEMRRNDQLLPKSGQIVLLNEKGIPITLLYS
jgi:hypothetical protein